MSQKKGGLTESKFNFKNKDLDSTAKNQTNNLTKSVSVRKDQSMEFNNYENNNAKEDEGEDGENDYGGDFNDIKETNEDNVEKTEPSEVEEAINPIMEITEKKKLNKLNQSSNVNTKLINGELKVQVKSAKNIILPKTMINSCEFFLKLSLDGANDDNGLDSKHVEAYDDTKITFN